jgi:hypothetical protein
MPDRYVGDCLVHARRIAALLAAEGRTPWIARIRCVEQRGDAVFTHPLIPKRFLGKGALAWTTHYVACADGQAYDPIAGEPVPIDDYVRIIFGDVPATMELAPSTPN